MKIAKVHIILLLGVFLILLNAPYFNQYQIYRLTSVPVLTYILAGAAFLPLFLFNLRRPSSIFVFGYYFLIFLPPILVLTFKGYYYNNIVYHCVHFFLILLIVAGVQLTSKHLVIKHISSFKINLLIVLFLLIISQIIIIFLMQDYFSLSIADVYKRRLAARDLLTVPVLKYMFQWSVGFLLIYGALLARWSPVYRSVVILISLSGFLTVGVKAATGLAIIISLTGFLPKKMIHKSDQRLVFIVIVILPFISLVSEIFLSYSYLNDYILRRLISVNGIIQNEFWFYINNPVPTSTSVEYYVGSLLYHEGTNGNVNWLLSSLANRGILATALFLVTLSMLLWVLDSMSYKDSSTNMLKWIAFALIFFMSEQDFGIVLLSSGGFLVLCLEAIRKRTEYVL